VKVDDAAGCPPAPPGGLEFSPLIQRDLTGDHQEDVAAVVISTDKPARYGVVALHREQRGYSEQWIVPLQPNRLRGVGIFSNPWGTYLFVGGCQPPDTKPFEWLDGKYVPAVIY